MSFKIGINGFGRIGRAVLRSLAKQNFPFQISMINELGDSATNAHLLKHDSVHGAFPGEIIATEKGLRVCGHEIIFTQQRDPALIPWAEAGVDIVLECTGFFTAKEQAALHLKGGAKKVLISAPAKNPDLTVAMGINLDQYNPAQHHIISNASCTTNCLAPVAKVLHESFGIEKGLMTTIHSYTNDQRILDVGHEDLRRARAAALSQIPTKTGAASAVGLVLPALNGKIDGMAIRVPTPNVSCVDLVCLTTKNTSAEAINTEFISAAAGSLKGILAFEKAPLVSIDYNGNTHSSIVDGLSTKVIGGNLVKVLAWYDNEMGFSTRLVELAQFVGAKL